MKSLFLFVGLRQNRYDAYSLQWCWGYILLLHFLIYYFWLIVLQ
jgi:hypothetical protein